MSPDLVVKYVCQDSESSQYTQVTQPRDYNFQPRKIFARLCNARLIWMPSVAFSGPPSCQPFFRVGLGGISGLHITCRSSYWHLVCDLACWIWLRVKSNQTPSTTKLLVGEITWSTWAERGNLGDLEFRSSQIPPKVTPRDTLAGMIIFNRV